MTARGWTPLRPRNRPQRLFAHPSPPLPPPSHPQARKGLHPLLYRIPVVGTKGGTFPIWSSVQHKAGKYFQSADQDTNAVWTGKKVAVAATGQVAKFKRRFDFLSAADIGGKKKK